MSAEPIRDLELEFVRASPKTVWAFVRLIGENGGQGVGEASLFGREAALRAAGDALTLGLTGKPLVPETIQALPLPAELPAAALASAAEQAAHDAVARAQRSSVADRLGRRRERVPVYANINRRTRERTPESFAASARAAVAAGHVAVKLAPFDEVDPTVDDFAVAAPGLARIAAVREALAPACDVMVDCHWRFAPELVDRLVDACRERGVSWLECPVVEHPDAIPALKHWRARCARAGMFLAGLEEQIGLAAFAPYLDAGAYDAVMPDVKYVGGLRELMRVAERAARCGVAVSPHNPSGPVCHAATLHVSACLADLHSVEMQFDESALFDELLVAPVPGVSGGGIEVGRRPGFGVELRPEQVAAHRVPAA